MTRVSRILLKLVVALILLGASAVAYVAILGIDEDPPDDSDMLLTWADIPDADNAFTYFNQAAQQVYWPKDKSESLCRLQSGEAWDDGLAQEFLQKNRQTLALFERGMACEQFQFPDYRQPVPKMMPWMNMGRFLAVRVSAIDRAGRSVEALGEACKLVRFAQRMENGRGCLVVYLVASSARHGAEQQIRMILRKADLGPAELRAFARQLEGCEVDGMGLADTFRIEYMFMARIYETGFDGLVSNRRLTPASVMNPWRFLWSRFIYKPNQTKRVLRDYLRAEVDNSTKVYSQLCHAPLPFDPENSDRTSLAWRFVECYVSGNGIGNILLPAVPAAMQPQVRGALRDRVRSRVTVTLVALKAYRVRTGRLPATLAELVPDYLDAVPIDDMDGQTLRYSARKKVLYSVGTDLADDGGSKDEDIVFEIDF